MAVHRNLDDSPKIFGITANQFFPWLGITVFVGFIGNAAKFSWATCIFLDFWLITVYYFLTRKGLHHFFGKFVDTPYWVRGIPRYEKVLGNHYEKNRQKNHSRAKRKKAKP
jgi:hypothetical protein